MSNGAPPGRVQFYTFPHFEATGLVTHGFTTRSGGVSKGPYAGLNTAFHVGDALENVRLNRALACQALKIDARSLIAGMQVHGDGVKVVEQKDTGRGALTYEESVPDTDALVTGASGVPLSSYYADCVPVFLLDPGKKVIAIAHAGWKGTVLKIGLKTVEEMKVNFGTDPIHCLAGLGPSIGPCCYEVDKRVILPIRRSFAYWKDLTELVCPGKWRLNLWEANRRTLLEAGLKPENIVTASICTSCRNDMFFSYRAQNGMAGRAAALIMLKQRKG